MTPSVNPGDAVGTEFTRDEVDEAYPAGYELHYWHCARSAIVRDYVGACCRTGDTVLEIGSSRGHYVRVLRAAGFNAYGCDLGNPSIHEDVRAFVFPNTGFADLDENLRRRVTAVLLLDVLEHIERPSDFLSSIMEALPAVASVIIAVPARQELWSNYDEHFRHFLRYDISRLRDVVRDSHLRIEQLELFLPRALRSGMDPEKVGLEAGYGVSGAEGPISGCTGGSGACSGWRAGCCRKGSSARR